jgi:hypothetical protein
MCLPTQLRNVVAGEDLIDSKQRLRKKWLRQKYDISLIANFNKTCASAF